LDLAGARAIVTGGARGLGRTFAERLLEAGAKVAVCDVRGAGLEEAFAPLAAKVGDRLVWQKVDVGEEAEVQRFVTFANERLGGVNALVNNAGVLRDGLLVRKDDATGKVTALKLAQIDSVMRTNLLGPTLMTREVAAAMLARGEGGVIVNIASIARHGNAGQTAYAGAKSALSSCTKTWAVELAPHGIRVGCVAPGLVQTPMLDGMPKETVERLSRRIPLGRVGTPDDIWLAVRFVLECEYFTGRTIDVDGALDL
jgi:3-oxoacyl-[acyl-carrier protein] reductase